MNEKEAFEKANKVLHPVETQWHYETMTAAGYKCDDDPQEGFVRSYLYYHPETGRKIKVTTGCNADYWNDLTSGEFGYWGSLQNHVASKSQP